MTKTLLITTCIAVMGLSPMAAQARDDGGFGTATYKKAPAALGDNTQELIAKGDIVPSSVADIEPAAGGEKAASPTQPPTSKTTNAFGARPADPATKLKKAANHRF